MCVIILIYTDTYVHTYSVIINFFPVCNDYYVHTLCYSLLYIASACSAETHDNNINPAWEHAHSLSYIVTSKQYYCNEIVYILFFF